MSEEAGRTSVLIVDDTVENLQLLAGLGLAFCKLAVQAHAGSIGVEDAAAWGSIFGFVLPA
jgi:K+-sensing histidine kinase KdpD